MMKIVVLDGYTLNPGDLSWQELERLGEVTVHERTPAEQVAERAAGAEAVFVNKIVMSEEVLSQLPDLRYIGVLATGYNIVDVSAAAKRGVTVTNVPTYATTAVAQAAFALLLELCHHVQVHSDAVRDGEWSRCPDFCFWKYPIVELVGKTMGIIGFGRIGRAAGRIASAFGMKVLAADAVRAEAPEAGDVRWAEAPELLGEADAVSLHCPLTPETEGMINRESLALMKPSAFLVNTSRGGLVKDAELAEALNNGRIAGAALDVLSVEPPLPENPLLTAKNCLITPHIAWAARESRARLMATAIENLEAFVAGRPVNVVG